MGSLYQAPREVLRGKVLPARKGAGCPGSPVRAWEPGHFTGLSEVRKLNPRVGGGEMSLAPGCLGGLGWRQLAGRGCRTASLLWS